MCVMLTNKTTMCTSYTNFDVYNACLSGHNLNATYSAFSAISQIIVLRVVTNGIIPSLKLELLLLPSGLKSVLFGVLFLYFHKMVFHRLIVFIECKICLTGL